MIIVKVKRDSNGYIKSFELSGHANSGPYGQDIVCAGVSAVSFGSINAILKLTEAPLNIEQSEDGGFLRCSIPTDIEEPIKEKIHLLLEAMIVSLETIEAEYGKYMKIKS